jgi:hypothetical protein
MMRILLGAIVIIEILCSTISVAADQDQKPTKSKPEFQISVNKTQAMYETDVLQEIGDGDTVARLSGKQQSADISYILMVVIEVTNLTKKETSLKLQDFNIVSGEEKFNPFSYSEKEGDVPIVTKRKVQFGLPAGGKKTLVLYFPAYREKATALLKLTGAMDVSLNRPPLPKENKESKEKKP